MLNASEDDCKEGYERYDRAMLTLMLEKLVTTKPAAHRPRRAVAGTRIQPDTDLVPDNSDEDEEDEDLTEL